MNLYVHFPFCRAKCAYCALHSRAGSSAAARAAHVARVGSEIAARAAECGPAQTIYFGGGSPALCDLAPLADALGPLCAGPNPPEFTVELHPLDVAEKTLRVLRGLGVNRVSMGVQSLDDGVLASMGRGHGAAQAEDAFRLARSVFPNAGIDLIAGWPGVSDAVWRGTVARAVALAPAHVSCYTLIREPGTRLDLAVRRGAVALPSDDAALAQIDAARADLEVAGLARYEVSSYAAPGFECRHNLAVWRGEDYVGVGEGARGREGLVRTAGLRDGYDRSTVTKEEDAVERAIFALRTSFGLDLAAAARRWPVLEPRLPEWRETLSALEREGIVAQPAPDVFAPTSRGFEVCDAIMAELLGHS